jgi:hypothetical protein
MKAVTSILLSIFSIVMSFAQNEGNSESVKPTWGVTLEREVLVAEIDKKSYIDVTVELKAAELGDIFADGVKVTVVDNTGKKIYRKRFSKSYLYVLSDGTIVVAKGDALTQMIVFKFKDGNGWKMVLKEKGIY